SHLGGIRFPNLTTRIRLIASCAAIDERQGIRSDRGRGGGTRPVALCGFRASSRSDPAFPSTPRTPTRSLGDP
ncbi:MAG: hypothetical protein ACTH31_10900, partial [Pseudoclavibacter sp.]